MQTDTIYSRLVEITAEYLGPAAPRFINRQISSHLNKSPQSITASDIPNLAEWLRITLALLTEDQQVVEEYAQKISNLSS